MPPAPHHRHQWHMRFDSVCCRNCCVTGDDGMACGGASKVRPMAGMRRYDEADHPPGYDVPTGSRIDAARRRAAEFFGDRGRV